VYKDSLISFWNKWQKQDVMSNVIKSPTVSASVDWVQKVDICRWNNDMKNPKITSFLDEGLSFESSKIFLYFSGSW
jgi:hypothetical protein